ncbi:hypothetical protein H1R20_g12682, partial [Candolleomyces eurysporus]
MTVAIYTKTEIDLNYLIFYIRIYFVLGSETKIHLGSFIVRNLISDVLNAAQIIILCPLSTSELTAALALFNQKYAEQTSELLQQLWIFASLDPPSIICSALLSVATLPSNQTSPDLKPAKCKRATSNPNQPKQAQHGNPNPTEPSSSPTG